MFVTQVETTCCPRTWLGGTEKYKNELEAKVQPCEDYVNMQLGILQFWQMKGTKGLTLCNLQSSHI